MTLGSLGVAIEPFEETFTLKPRASPSVTDGYVVEGTGSTVTIKGVFIPRPTRSFLAALSGTDTEGDATFVMRTEGQPTYPNLQDELVDANGVTWIVIAERDYTVLAYVRVFVLRRKLT